MCVAVSQTPKLKLVICKSSELSGLNMKKNAFWVFEIKLHSPRKLTNSSPENGLF